MEWMPNLKRHGLDIKSQETTTDQSHILFHNITVGTWWEDLRREKSPHDIFTHFAHLFQLNLDETSFLWNDDELKVVLCTVKNTHKKCSAPRFSIELLWVGSAAVVNGPFIFIAKGTLVHPSLRGTKLVTKYRLAVGSCVITNKPAYTDCETWTKLMKPCW